MQFRQECLKQFGASVLAARTAGVARRTDLVRKIAQPIREAKAAEVPARAESAPDENEDPRLFAIRKIMDERIRPTLVMDGGDLEIMTLCGNLLCIRYYGTCASCPSSQTGTLMAIRR